MKSVTAITVAALATVAQAVQFTNSNFNVDGQSTFTFTWSGAAGPVSLILKNGSPTNLQTVQTITSGQTGTSFTWTVPSNLPSGSYAVEIEDSSGETNFSQDFPLTGTGTSSAASSSETSASTTGSSSQTSSAASTSSATTSRSSSASSTKSPSKTSSSPTAAQTTSVPGSAGRLSSPLALILVSVAAMFYFH